MHLVGFATRDGFHYFRSRTSFAEHRVPGVDQRSKVGVFDAFAPNGGGDSFFNFDFVIYPAIYTRNRGARNLRAESASCRWKKLVSGKFRYGTLRTCATPEMEAVGSGQRWCFHS
jgi:hypothetical protein